MNDTRQTLADALAPAYQAFQRDDAATAWQLGREAATLHPEAFEAQMFAATAALSAGEQEQALAHFEQAFRLAPSLEARALVWLGSGRSRLELVDGPGAYQAFQRGLALAPHHPELQTGMGRALLLLGRFEEAEQALRQALTAIPGDVRAQVSLGAVLVRRNQLSEARNLLERFREDPHFGNEARLHLIGLCIINGELDRARTELEALMDLPYPPPVYLQWAQLVSFEDRDGAAWRRLASGEAKLDKLRRPARVDLLFALAKAYDECGDNARAARCLSEANGLEARLKPYDPDRDEALMQRIAELFTREFVERHAEAGLKSIQPIFIASLPRSGSTLMEQMLAAHSQVNGGGEMPHLAQVASRLSLKWGADPNFPDIAPHTAAEDIRQAAAQYQSLTERLALLHPRFTDKGLTNFLYIGLIRMLLPDARIVHIRRHPLATVFGIYRQQFNRSVPYALELDNIARYYRAYARLMQHWRETTPQTLVEVRYEELVRASEEELRRVLAHLGLEFEPQCLEFHQLERAVLTASQVQVRRPLNTSGLYRHERYHDLLAPAAEVLQDEISAYEAELTQPAVN